MPLLRFGPLVNRDPRYAAAWGLLAQVYVQASGPNDFFEGGQGRTRSHAARSAKPECFRDIGRYELLSREVDRCYDGFRRALAGDPNEPDVLARHWLWLALTGRTKEALVLGEKLTMLEPFMPVYNSAIARFKVNAGQIDDALVALERMQSDPLVGLALSRAYALEGRYAAAADAPCSYRAEPRRCRSDSPRRPAQSECTRTSPRVRRPLAFCLCPHRRLRARFGKS